jgi:hypothetical protein
MRRSATARTATCAAARSLQARTSEGFESCDWSPADNVRESLETIGVGYARELAAWRVPRTALTRSSAALATGQSHLAGLNAAARRVAGLRVAARLSEGGGNRTVVAPRTEGPRDSGDSAADRRFGSIPRVLLRMKGSVRCDLLRTTAPDDD